MIVDVVIATGCFYPRAIPLFGSCIDEGRRARNRYLLFGSFIVPSSVVDTTTQLIGDRHRRARRAAAIRTKPTVIAATQAGRAPR